MTSNLMRKHHWMDTTVLDMLNVRQTEPLNWNNMTPNANAAQLLREYSRPKFYWSTGSINHTWFYRNYAEMRKAAQPFAEELATHVFHPLRLQRIAEQLQVELIDVLAMYD